MITDLTKAECEKVLAANRYAHLGCVDGDEPYVVPITYVYDGGFIYGYTHAGRKIDLLRKNPNMCVQVETVENGNRWESVICWGRFEEVTEAKTIQQVELLLGEQYGKSVLAHEPTPVSPLVEGIGKPHGDAAVLYRMQPHRITGRAER